MFSKRSPGWLAGLQYGQLNIVCVCVCVHAHLLCELCLLYVIANKSRSIPESQSQQADELDTMGKPITMNTAQSTYL